MSKIYPITEFDSITLPATMQIFKSIIPFMDYNLQRSFSMFIRTNELLHTMNFYKTPGNCKIFKSCSSNVCISSSSSIQDILNNESIINMILKYCPEDTENSINQIRTFLSMSDLFKVSHSGFDNGFLFNEKSLLNTSQQKLYDQYIHQLDEIDLNKK